MMKFVPLILIAAASPTIAQVGAPQPQPVAEAAKKNPLDKVVCKTEQTVGTRLGGHRVCATVREWQEQQQANREALEKIQQQGTDILPSS